VPADPLPALELLVAVGSGDEGEDGMIVAGAQDVDDLGVLQVPPQSTIP
jgi:NAD(P)H-hydrate repair Nnr-like enzyme with NAD(P)H-hydrate epimerase domain